MLRWNAIFLSFLLAFSAQAGTVSRLFDFQPHTPAQADQVDAELDNILSTLNGNINSDNLLDGGIATADIASYAVTQAKLGPKGQQISSSSALVESASVLESLVQNMTDNITVISRPVFVGLQASGSGPGGVTYRNGGTAATSNVAYISFNRDQATVNQLMVNARVVSSYLATQNVTVALPCSAFSFIDVPTAGPHNYTASFRVATNDSGVIQVENCKLVVFEL